jgi:hypothetical protein
MKKLFTKFLALSSIAVLMLASCKKDEIKTVTTGGTGGTLSVSSTTPVLTKATSTNTAVTFTWTSPVYEYKAAPTNTLQIAVKGTNFADVKQLKEITLPVGTLKQDFTVMDFNAYLLGMNLSVGTAAQLEVRVKSEIGTTVTPVYSNLLNMTATPFALSSFFYVPGAYQGWEPTTADSLISLTSNGIYTGAIKFPAVNSEFKVTPLKKWDVAYGDAGGGKISTSGGNFKAPAMGYNLITIDTKENTFKIAPTLWSIIGDAANGWDAGNDVDMTYDSGKGEWVATLTLKSTGAFKFRLNHDWAVSYGDKTGDFKIDTDSDNNIKVAATGTYKVALNMNSSSYTVTKL